MGLSDYQRAQANLDVVDGTIASDEALEEHRKSLTLEKETKILEVNLLAQQQLQLCLKQMRYQVLRTGPTSQPYLELVEHQNRLKAIIKETEQLLASMRSGLKFNEFIATMKDSQG